MNKTIINIIRFFVLIALQIFIFNNIKFFGYYSPNIYLLFLLLLPIKTKPWLLIFFGFCLGFTIDIFNSTLGIHAASCTLIALIQPFLIRLTHDSKKENFKDDSVVSISAFGLRRSLLFVLFYVFMHHTAMFYLESFGFNNFFHTLWSATVNTLVTILFIYIDLMLFHNS